MALDHQSTSPAQGIGRLYHLYWVEWNSNLKVLCGGKGAQSLRAGRYGKVRPPSLPIIPRVMPHRFALWRGSPTGGCLSIPRQAGHCGNTHPRSAFCDRGYPE